MQCVFFNLSREWEQEEHVLRERLAREGILCAGFARTDGSLTLIKKNQDAVVLTDSLQTGAELAREGIVYFGCCHAQNVRENRKSAMKLTGADAAANVGSGWFDGAALVLEGFEEVDAEYLEQWMRRAKGMPAMIARTNRLTIREIADEDIPELERIGRECGEAEAQDEPNERILDTGKNICEEKKLHVRGNRFTKEYLYSYRRTAYRLQGFGLWSVLYRDRVIGCCGFEPWDDEAAVGIFTERGEKIILYHLNIGTYRDTFRENTEEHRERNILEMQYMLAPAYHRQGFGTEMCRAALAYARERLDVDEVRLRIRESNLASRALAKELGFLPVAGFGEA